MSSDETRVQLFSLSQLGASLGADNRVGHEGVVKAYEAAGKTVDEFMPTGFSLWVERDDVGHIGTYSKGGNGSSFLIRNVIIDGIVRRQSVRGTYPLGCSELSIAVDKKPGSKVISANVYVDGGLVASRTSPNDWAGQKANEFLRQTLIAQGRNPSTLDKTLDNDRSPYPLAAKMLSDLCISVPDLEMIDKMKTKLRAKGKDVVDNSEYRFK